MAKISTKFLLTCVDLSDPLTEARRWNTLPVPKTQ